MYQPTGFSLDIFKKRYAFTDDESWQQACQRVANQMAIAEVPSKQHIYKDKFNEILVNNLFVPGGRIWYNSGRNDANLLNCFVLDPNKDSKEGWGNSAKNMIITSMHGGGCGDDMSEVRPKGASIGDQKGESPGAVELMRLIDNCAQPVRAGGQRRVALMFSLDLDHPDVDEFLDAKLVKGQLTHANVSVRSKNTKDFIKAIHKNAEWELHWKGKYKKTVQARELWNKIVTNAYNTAEPGFLNWELVESESNIHYVENLVSTNPCVSGDTLILSRDGYIRIDSVVDKTLDIWNGFEWSQVTPQVTGKNQRMKLVTFNNGAMLNCTEYHKFHIQSDDEVRIVEAKELKVGMKLINYTLPFDQTSVSDVTIVDIKSNGVDDTVYCFNEPKRHLGIFNGILTGQCGEIALSAYDCCCLGHLVLPRFISNDTINWSALADTVRLGVRFLDNVLTVNSFPLPEMKAKSAKLRRIGLGTTGLADTLALLGYAYGSESANKFIDKLYRFISKVAYESSVMLAIEKGAFPACIPEKHVESGFMKRMPAKIKSLVLEHGIRNCAVITQAPCGTVSILSGNCSSGIEPMFAAAYERRWWDANERKTEVVFHPVFAQLMKEGKSVDHLIGAQDLNVRDHLEVQKIIQRHVDNAVSKTINIKHDYPMEKMEELWLEYLPYLKGTTFYRENTRGYVDENGVVQEPPLKAIDLKEAMSKFNEQSKIDAVNVDDCPNGVCEIK